MEPQTIVIMNFNGNLARNPNGPLTSGMARYATTNGINPYAQPETLTFLESARDIKGEVITDLIVGQKIDPSTPDTAKVYAIGHTARLYSIQVNDVATKNVDYDTPTLLTTLILYTLTSTTGFNAGDAVTSSSGGVGVVLSVASPQITIQITSGTFQVSDTITDTTTVTTTNITTVANPTFNHGGYLERYGPYVFIGHDTGVMRVDVNGANQTIVGSPASWTSDVPRPLKVFIGNLYVGNANNIAEITSGYTVTTYGKLNPAPQSIYRIVDLDVTADGVYLVLSSPRVIPENITSVDPDTNQIPDADSVIEYWNGTDNGITRFNTFPPFNLSAYLTFASYEYVFGNNGISASFGTPSDKILTLSNMYPPLPNAMSTIGNMIIWMSPEYVNGKLNASLHAYGQFDSEYSLSQYRHLLQSSTLTNGDVLKVPSMLPVTNFTYGGQTSGYTNNIIGKGKIYFSTLEYNGSTTAYGFWAFDIFPIVSNNALGGVYETQQQLFGKKVVCKEVRIYLNPVVAGNSFKIDLIGIDGNVLTDSSGLNTFTEGTARLASGETLAWYNPQHQPSAAIGIRVTNLGTVTPVIQKIELDIVAAGK